MSDATDTTQATQQHAIAVAVSQLLTKYELKMYFRKNTDETTGQVTKRPDVNLEVPVLTVEGLVAELEKGSKCLDAILTAANDLILAAVKEWTSDTPDANQAKFDELVAAGKFSFEYLANLPRATRSAAISEELWKAFARDYNNVMLPIIKNQEKVTNHIVLYTQKFRPLNGSSQAVAICKKLQECIGTYVSNAPDTQEFSIIIDYINGRLDEIIQKASNNLLDAL